MDRTEFKKRMLSLKSYRELNPGKGYWDWRNSLPDDLPYTDDLEYDMKAAYESGALPELLDDGTYHLPSRDSRNGRILKKSIHPTYWKGLGIDAGLDYNPYFFGNDTYTWNDKDGALIPWLNIELFEEGGDNTPMWLLESYQGPTYDLVLESLKKEHPEVYSKLRTNNKTTSNSFLHNVKAVLNNIKKKTGILNLNRDPEIIDLTNRNVSRIESNTPNVDMILFNDFVEWNNPNNIRKAKDFKNTNDTLIGDKSIPLSRIRLYYGVEDGKIKVGDISIFDDNTVIVPKRNRYTDKVKKVIPNILNLQLIKLYKNVIQNFRENEYKNQRRKFTTELAKKYNLKQNLLDRITSFFTGLPTYNSTVSKRGMIRDRKDTIAININKALLTFKPKYTPEYLQAITALGTRSGFITTKGDTIRDDVSLNGNKMFFGDESGNAIFVNKLLNLDKEDLNTLNLRLNDTPMYPVLIDNGRYSHYYNNPSQGDYDKYTSFDFQRGHNDLYVIGTTNNSYAEGGEVPPDNSPVRVNPFTGKPLANGAITPILNIEDAANFTPAGDVLSIRDAYIAAKNNDLLGLGLAGLGFLPFVPRIGRSKVSKVDRPPIPEVHPDYFQKLMEKAERAATKRKLTVNDFYALLDQAYESLIENEDAFRRAVNADISAGTNYTGVYGDYIKNYSRESSRHNDNLTSIRLTDDIPSEAKALVDPRDLNWIRVNSRYADPDELDPVFLQMNPGLVRHELGHITDERAGLDYTNKLGDRSKFESESKLKEMFPKTYKRVQDYLLRGSEIKSHMNEFRDYLSAIGLYSPTETAKSLRLKLDKYGSNFKNLKILFDSYKSKSQFARDYNTIPLIGTSALGINYYLNQEEQRRD